MKSTGFRVRAGGAADLDSVVALDRAIEHAPHWPRSVYEAALKVESPSGPDRRVFVAEEPDAGLIVGFSVGYAPRLDEAVGELESVAVVPAARRSGVGRRLCDAIFEWCQGLGCGEITLEVRAGDLAAGRLYASLGFIEVARRPRYYANPTDDAVFMRLRFRSQ